MKRYLVLGALLFAGMMVFRIAERLSPDAIGMGVGVLFGLRLLTCLAQP